MAEIDISRPPSGDNAARALVAALAEKGDLAERHYLEIKGPINLSSAEGAAKVAKFILGAANRMPDVAATAFQGYAVMVIGVTGGTAPGIDPVEVLTISQKIAKFLPDPAPRWDVTRVPVENGKEVLLILVDPPEWGQPPFICQKGGEGNLCDGGVYVRADGETRRANAHEMADLIRRSQPVKPEVDLAVELTGAAYVVTWDNQKTINAFLEATMEKLQQAGPDSPYSPQPVFGTLPSLYQVKPDPRSADEYFDEITSWMNATYSKWPGAVEKLLPQLFPAPKITVTNRSEVFFQDMELSIHLPGDVNSFRSSYDEESGPSRLDLPSVPRRWGPYIPSTGFSSDGYLQRNVLSSSPLIPTKSHLY